MDTSEGTKEPEGNALSQTRAKNPNTIFNRQKKGIHNNMRRT